MKLMMINLVVILFCCGILHLGSCIDPVKHVFEEHTEDNEKSNLESDSVRGRRGVIEEEKYYNIHMHQQDSNVNQPWVPGPLPFDDDASKVSITNEVKDSLPLHQTTERVTDKPTGRGARASNENWIKLPVPGRDELQRDQLQRDQLQRDQLQRDQLQRDQIQRNQRDEILTPPQPSGELINSRMPRVNFVTQNKALDTSETRNNKDSVQRATRTENIRTEFVRPDEERNHKPVFPRQAVYNQIAPEESRHYFYDGRFGQGPDMYQRDLYRDVTDDRLYYPYGGRYEDNYARRKPKRIIYYAHLPEVVRNAPQAELRYRYLNHPDDYYARNGRSDYRFRDQYNYIPLRKDVRGYRDLDPAGTNNKDKKADKVMPTPILPQKEERVVPVNRVPKDNDYYGTNQMQYQPNFNNFLAPNNVARRTTLRDDDDSFFFSPTYPRYSYIPRNFYTQ